MTLLYTDPLFARHQMPAGHPERAERMDAVDKALAAGTFDALDRRTAEPAPFEAIARAHPERYLQRLQEAVPDRGLVSLDPDTHMGPDSFAAATLASGALMAAVDEVVAGRTKNAFVASRPPGHHAERTRAMGFCLVNHVAIAARHAQARHGVERVAIVDFDVHHGNGTQDIFYDDASVLYVSTHQSPLYPGTGAASETGVGNILNLPLPARTDGSRYRTVFRDEVVPRIDQFAPDLILLSSGFDAHADDPLGGMLLEDGDFVWITEEMLASAERHTAGRLVSILEGGYDLGALGRCTAAHVDALMRA